MTRPLYIEIAVPTPLRQTFIYATADDFRELDSAVPALEAPMAQTPQPGTPRPGTPRPGTPRPGTPRPGTRFYMQFGRQKLVGVMLGTVSNPELPSAKIRSVIRQLDSTPVLPEAIVTLCRWAADYYHHPVGEVFSSALPRLLREGEALASSERYLMLANAELIQRAPRQAGLQALLQQNPTGLSPAQLKAAGINSATIRALVERGYAHWSERLIASTDFSPGASVTHQLEVQLNAEQALVVATIDQGPTATWLLDGITGSGKTEVYFRIIERVLAKGRQALVLVPEIGLTPQTVRRFQARFNLPIVALHSGLSDRERLEGFRAASDGSAAVIIGTRSAIFTPMKNPGLIVVDEEHDASFKQQEGFRYSARDLAVMRGQLESIPVILGSATPSLETYQNVAAGKYRRVALTERAGGAQPPQYQILGIRNESLQEGFSSRLISLIGEHLQRQSQVLVFLNRRGFSPTLLCHACGWLAECRRCDARLTYHAPLRALLCHHCGSQAPLPDRCPSCQSTQLVPLGAGTQRIEGALQKLFPGQTIIRIDRDTTSRKSAFNEILEQLDNDQPAILVGTQLLAKGHHFPNVTLVAIVDMDSGFYSADFKATERMGQLLLQVGGRAGREQKPGTVALQTHFPEQPILRTLIHQGYRVFAKQLLEERQVNDLPPFAHHALVRAEASKKTDAMAFLAVLQRQLKPHPSVSVLGPVVANMERRAGRFRAQLLFSASNRRDLHQSLDACLQLIDANPPRRHLRWSLDVDPVDLF